MRESLVAFVFGGLDQLRSPRACHGLSPTVQISQEHCSSKRVPENEEYIRLGQTPATDGWKMASRQRQVSDGRYDFSWSS